MDRRRFLVTSLAGVLTAPLGAGAQQAGKDPVGSGLVRSLAQPGGNIAGTANAGPELSGKQLELLKEAVPSLSRVGVFINSAFSFHVAARPAVEAAARGLGLSLIYVEVRTPEDINGAFAEISREKLGTVLILAQPLAFAHRARLAELALAHRVVTMIGWRLRRLRRAR